MSTKLETDSRLKEVATKNTRNTENETQAQSALEMTAKEIDTITEAEDSTVARHSKGKTNSSLSPVTTAKQTYSRNEQVTNQTTGNIKNETNTQLAPGTTTKDESLSLQSTMGTFKNFSPMILSKTFLQKHQLTNTTLRLIENSSKISENIKTSIQTEKYFTPNSQILTPESVSYSSVASSLNSNNKDTKIMNRKLINEMSSRAESSSPSSTNMSIAENFSPERSSSNKIHTFDMKKYGLLQSSNSSADFIQSRIDLVLSLDGLLGGLWYFAQNWP